MRRRPEYSRAEDARCGRTEGRSGMSKSRDPARLELRATCELLIGGAFVRAAAGRTDTARDVDVARAGRDDVRAAVAAATAAAGAWAALAPAARGRALFAIARGLENAGPGCRAALEAAGNDRDDAAREHAAAVDRIVWYAGWCDKIAGLLGSRIPTAGPYDAVVDVAPLGVIGTLAPAAPLLLGAVESIVPPLVAGNAVVAAIEAPDPRSVGELARVLAAALPAGVANVLYGAAVELVPELARDARVAGLGAAGLDAPFAAELQRLAAGHAARLRLLEAPPSRAWPSEGELDLGSIAAFMTSRALWQSTAI